MKNPTTASDSATTRPRQLAATAAPAPTAQERAETFRRNVADHAKGSLAYLPHFPASPNRRTLTNLLSVLGGEYA